MSNLELLMQLSMAVADPGCLDRGFKFTRGFDLLIVPAYMLYFTDFSETSPRKLNNFVKKGSSSEPPEAPLDPPLDGLDQSWGVKRSSGRRLYFCRIRVNYQEYVLCSTFKKGTNLECELADLTSFQMS